MIKTIKVSEKGQIAIPQVIRDSLGINQGDDLIMIQMNNKILLEKSQKMEQKLQDNFKDILKFSEQSLKDVWDNSDDEIWNSYLKKKK
ncbi:MAG: AbrB/MazE/SpoVT family DNA-binding domain-containing protein [Nanoarchaeota archaeon]